MAKVTSTCTNIMIPVERSFDMKHSCAIQNLILKKQVKWQGQKVQNQQKDHISEETLMLNTKALALTVEELNY